MIPKDLGTLVVTLEDGSTSSLLLRAIVRQGVPVLEVRDAETVGHEEWTVFPLGKLPTAVSLSRPVPLDNPDWCSGCKHGALTGCDPHPMFHTCGKQNK